MGPAASRCRISSRRGLASVLQDVGLEDRDLVHGQSIDTCASAHQCPESRAALRAITVFGTGSGQSAPDGATDVAEGGRRRGPRDPRQPDRWPCPRLHRRVTVMVTGPPPARSGRERDRVQQQIEVATMTTQSVGDTERRFAAHEHRDLALGLAYIAETVERSRAFSSTGALGPTPPHVGLARERTPAAPGVGSDLALSGVRRHRRDAVGDQASALRAPPDRSGIAALEVDSARWFGHSTPQTDADLVAHLSAIRALIAAHIEREDRFLLPLLEERGEVVGSDHPLAGRTDRPDRPHGRGATPGRMGIHRPSRSAEPVAATRISSSRSATGRRLHHFDPERVDLWVNCDSRGTRLEMHSCDAPPRDGVLVGADHRSSDRLGVSNEYVSLGGRLTVDAVDGMTIAALSSPAPILRRGGHSQAGTMPPSTWPHSSVGSCWPLTTFRTSRGAWPRRRHWPATERSSSFAEALSAMRGTARRPSQPVDASVRGTRTTAARPSCAIGLAGAEVGQSGGFASDA